MSTWTPTKTITRIALAVVALAALTGCTPAQISTFERLSGIDLTRTQEREALAAPNVAVETPWGRINVDGSVSPIVAPAGSACPQFYDEALRAGWTQSDWYRLDPIIWRESRCTPSARSTTRDSGLTQINDVHLGWLAGYGITQPALYDPQTNLRAARLLYGKAQAAYGCGWQPWRGTC